MSDSNYTHITYILDGSGSMQRIKHDVIGGFNGFVESQKAVEGRCTLTLVQFDNRATELYSLVPLERVEPRSVSNYQPNGGTALLDAIGDAIVRTTEQIAAMQEDEKPGLVLFQIMTDGDENESKRFSYEEVQRLIKLSSEQSQWQFSFLGAGLDPLKDARKLGIDPNMAAAFTPESSQAAFESANRLSTRTRGAVARGVGLESSELGYTPGEREAMVNPVPKKP